MTDYTATPEQWAAVEYYADPERDPRPIGEYAFILEYTCILELRARIEALEVLHPKPPSLKEQALDAWDRLRNEAWCEEIDYDLDFVRRALEQLDD